MIVIVLLIIALGITNQRETTVVWDKVTGEPLHNAIGMLSKTVNISCARGREMIS